MRMIGANRSFWHKNEGKAREAGNPDKYNHWGEKFVTHTGKEGFLLPKKSGFQGFLRNISRIDLAYIRKGYGVSKLTNSQPGGYLCAERTENLAKVKIWRQEGINWRINLEAGKMKSRAITRGNSLRRTLRMRGWYIMPAIAALITGLVLFSQRMKKRRQKWRFDPLRH